LDLINKDMGSPTSNNATGRPIVITAKIAGLSVKNSTDAMRAAQTVARRSRQVSQRFIHKVKTR
jgi:hypothetical protein